MEPSAIRSLSSCLAEILLVQEANTELWESGIVKRAFSLLLSFCMQDNGKVRHHVQDEIMRLLQFHYERSFPVSSRQVIRQLDILCKSFNEDDFHDVINFLVFITKSCLILHGDVYPNLFSLLLKVLFSSSLHCRSVSTAARSSTTARSVPSKSFWTATVSSTTPSSIQPSRRSRRSRPKSPTTRRTWRSTTSCFSRSPATTSSSSMSTARNSSSPPHARCWSASPPPTPRCTRRCPFTSSPSTPVCPRS